MAELHSRYTDSETPSHRLPCGGVAIFDHSSGISYRCDTCFAVVGSIGMPRDCETLWRAALSRAEQEDGR